MGGDRSSMRLCVRLLRMSITQSTRAYDPAVLDPYLPEIMELAERIELAVKESRDDAAKAGIAKQLDLEDTIAALHRSLDEATEHAA
jgi:hypothetical protein